MHNWDPLSFDGKTQGTCFRHQEGTWLLSLPPGAQLPSQDPGPSAITLCIIPNISRTFVIEKGIPSQRSLMGMGTETMVASLHQLARLSLVTGLFSLPDFSHYLVNSVPICQVPGSEILVHCPFLSSFGSYVCQMQDSPSSELETHRGLASVLKKAIRMPAVSFYPRTWHARKCSMCISMVPLLPPAPMADSTNQSTFAH